MISLTNWLTINIIFLLLKFLIGQKQANYIIETREHMTFYAGLWFFYAVSEKFGLKN